MALILGGNSEYVAHAYSHVILYMKEPRCLYQMVTQNMSHNIVPEGTMVLMLGGTSIYEIVARAHGVTL